MCTVALTTVLVVPSVVLAVPPADVVNVFGPPETCPVSCVARPVDSGSVFAVLLAVRGVCSPVLRFASAASPGRREAAPVTPAA